MCKAHRIDKDLKNVTFYKDKQKHRRQLSRKICTKTSHVAKALICVFGKMAKPFWLRPNKLLFEKKNTFFVVEM